MINIADLPAVRAQLERDAAVARGEAVAIAATPAPTEPGQAAPTAPTASGSAYPAKALALEDGQYRVVDHGK